MDPATRKKIDAFFTGYPEHTFAKGEIIIHAHDNPNIVYHLLDGRVKQYDISLRGDEVVLNIFMPPAFFPMSLAINPGENLYFFEAETKARAQVAPADEVVKFLKDNPDVTYNLLARVYRGTDGLLGRLAHLMAGSARSRVMYEILIQARRFGAKHDMGLAIPASEGELGALAGLARETVNRELGKLKKQGVIVISDGEIVVIDVDKLASGVSQEL